METVTLKKLANLLGISITTVSKALKNYPDVSPKTKKAVFELAEQLNFTPNSFAVNLRTKHSNTIGLILPEVSDHFCSNVIKGVVEEANKHGYMVIILQSNESLELEKKQVELLFNKRVDGIIMSLSDQTNNDNHLKEILKRGIPFVQFDKISKLINSSKVVINDQKASMDAVQHLIDIGCKKIAHIRGPENPQNATDRFIGYKKALDKNGIPFNSKLVYTSDNWSFEEGYDFTEQILKDHPDVDGIFAVSDLVAIGVLSYLNEKRIKMPDQIALIGFSNWFMSKFMSPKLSTIDQPSYEMGVAAFSILLEEMISNKDAKPFKPRTIELETSLIARESSLKNCIKNT